MWRFLSSPFYRLPDLMWSFSRANNLDCAAAPCARGARMREASLPQTTCYPCWPLDTDPLSLHALMAPGERQGGQPLLKIGPQRAPCRLSSCPRPCRLAARPSRGSRRLAACRGAIRHHPCLAKPPQGNEHLARESNDPDPA